MKTRWLFSGLVLFLAACVAAPQASRPAAPAASATAPSSGHGTLHQSPLGFAVMVPDGWMILSQQDLKENAGLISADNPMFAKMDKNVIFVIKQKIESGNLELFMSTSMANLMFVSNINFAKQIGRLPADADAVKQLCEQLPGEYSQAFGKDIHFTQCGLETVAGQSALHLISTGALPNGTTIQYFLQQSANEILVITGTFSPQNLAKDEADLDSIVGSMKFQN